MKSFDVAIAGFGPVGAVLANLLGQCGMRVLVVEQATEAFDKPRAIGLDHESIRVFQSLGLAEDFMKNTRVYPGGVYLGVDGDPIKRFDPSPPPYALGWPPNVTFVQPELEALLRSGVARFPNVDVRLGHRLLDFQQTESGTTLHVQRAAGGAPIQFSAQYLIACDGANGLVRQRLGIPVEDQAFDEWWVVVDMLQRRESRLPEVSTQYCWPSRPATYVFGPGNLRRWELKLLPGETPDMFRDPARVLKALAPYVDTDAFDLWRSAVYRFHALVAHRWRVGRVFLAGDAAHQTPPFLGQGLGAGIRDVANLAWKLALVQKGSPDALLDTYETERKPHVTELISRAKEFGLEIGMLDTAKALQRDAQLREALAKTHGVTLRQRYVPQLSCGVIDTEDSGGHAGSLFLQPRVMTPDGIECLIDDAVGPGFLFVTDGLEPQSWFDADALDWWLELGGRRLALVQQPAPNSSGILELCETLTLLREWMRVAGAKAMLVRPDRYVYGIAGNPAVLKRQLRQIALQVRLTKEEAIQ